MQAFLRRAAPTGLVFLLAFAAYSLAAGGMVVQQSLAPHYIHLADALLHGHLDLGPQPASYDLLITRGRAFVAGSPMPAILLMPMVSVFGVQFSDILFGIVVGAANVALVHNLFHKRWLTLLFALGTPHLYLASLGSVWFNAHVVAIFFALLAVREAMTRRRWFLAGLWLACAGLARPTLLFGAVFFVLMIWFLYPARLRFRPLAFFSAAIVLGVAAHGLYNMARFGSPTDFGYEYTAGAQNITGTYARFSGFNLRFLPCNLYISLANPPEINGYVPAVTYDACSYLLQGVNLSDRSASVVPDPLGMSLFLVTPAFLLMFTTRPRTPVVLAAWAGLLAIMLPLWMYHNTGSLQFGYRYWMDAAPMWLLILSAAMEQPMPRLRYAAWVLLLLSIAINLWGYLWIYDKFTGMTWLDVLRGMRG